MMNGYSRFMTKTTKRRPLTKEEAASADKLKAIYNKEKNRLELTQSKLAAKYAKKFADDGASQGAISHYFNKHMALNVKAALFFAEELETPVEDFAPKWILKDIEKATATEASLSQDYFQINYWKDKRAAAGAGASGGDGRKEKIMFRYSWAEENEFPVDQLIAVSIKGHSMEPQIKDKDTVIARRDIKTLKNGEIYAFNQGDDTRVKRVYRKKRDYLLLVSDNPTIDEGPELWKRNELNDMTIIGKVVWRLGVVS